ncbi:hypothetical protein OIE66_42775 [Nonomuraea sp. NBC_01738]|uniref:lipid II flippase MurJ n=1 Tax=Nonomuraea sp. NBC_01738 TaxID=2976003 RepID=UPI002E11E7F2|nr:hypothetical protein OIE66_42775 [Nonomuraea sp. NBC_01738]
MTRAAKRPRSRLVRATSLTMLLTALGSLLGFARDLLVAGIFGATANTDAFLVAWTIPETAAPLLIEGALAFLLIPLFSRAVADGQGLRDVVSATLPRAATAFLLLTALTALGAPLIVAVLAPGMSDPELAAQCTRITSVTVLAFGLTGYLSAALRTRQVFGPPAAIYVAYNLGIIAFVLTAEGSRGVTTVAWGVAVGALLMVAVQVPAFVRHIGLPRRGATATAISLVAFAPIASFTLIRQGQVFVERFAASHLPAGSISYLNYAQKIAQVPMVVSLIVATVSFPALARCISKRDYDTARRRIREDLVVAGSVVLASTVFLLVYAPDVVRLLLEHGAFTAADTAETAWSMRLYSLGLLAQAVVGVICRVYYCADKPSWFPAAAMGAGLAVTTVAAVLLAPVLGAGGIALANALGITLTAVLLLGGLRAPFIELPMKELAVSMGRLVLAAAVAGGVAWVLRPAFSGLPLIVTVISGVALVTAIFVLTAVLIGSKDDLTAMLRPQKGGQR